MLAFMIVQPYQVNGLIPSFKSVLLSGMTAEILPPSQPEKVQILSAILRGARRGISKEIIEAVVARGGGSIKRLDRLARKIYAFAGLTGEPVTEAFLEKHLAEIAGPIDPAARRRDIIFQTIEDHFGVDREALLSKRKTQALAVPRAVAVILLREHGSYTFKDIGALLGERSHTSVYLMFKKYGPEVAQDPTLATLTQEVGRR